MLDSSHLRLVSSGVPTAAKAKGDAARRAPAAPAPARGDVALVGMLFGVNLVPLVGEAFRHGRWGPGTLGLATAGALVTGRELLLGVRSLLRRRR